jgi:hypothetical protein
MCTDPEAASDVVGATHSAAAPVACTQRHARDPVKNVLLPDCQRRQWRNGVNLIAHLIK